MEIYLATTEIVPLNNVCLDARRGKVLRSKFRYTYFNEGFAMGQINADHCVGPEFNKATGTRIALIGDSHVEGLQLFDRHHFRFLLEEGLISKGHGVQVMNFGRSNFSLGNMYAYNRLFVRSYEPKIMLYFISLDDFENAYPDPLLPQTRIDTLIGNLKVGVFANEGYEKKFIMINALLKKSRVFSLLNNCRKHINIFNSFHDLEFENNDSIFKINLLNKKIIKAIGKEKGVLVWSDEKAMPECLRAYIKENNLVVWNLKPVFDKMKAQGMSPTHWKATSEDGHWNHQAHMEIYKYLEDRILSASTVKD